MKPLQQQQYNQDSEDITQNNSCRNYNRNKQHTNNNTVGIQKPTAHQTTAKKKKNATSVKRRQKNCCPKGYILQDNGSGVLTCVQQLITTIADNLLQNPLYLKNFYDTYGGTNRYYNDYNDSSYRPPKYHHVSLHDEYDDEDSVSSSSISRRKSDW